MRKVLLLAGSLMVAASVALVGQPRPLTLRAGLVLDGKGGVHRNQVVTVDGNIIKAVSAPNGPATYDLGTATLLPGLIDTHVHIGWHFNKDGRADNSKETPTEAMLYGVENAQLTIAAGFTTVQSVGSPSDGDLRDAIARGIIPGPRILTSLRQINERTGAPEQLRQAVRTFKAEGADLVKIFASKSIREGGGRTLSDAQLHAACGEAAAQGLRTLVHAYTDDVVIAAAGAGCTQIEHGTLLTRAALEAMAAKGTYFDPNVHLVIQNYLDNRARFLGIGNYTDEGFAQMEKALPVNLAMFKLALGVKGLKIVFGTDAVAGAHGRNIEELVYRVQKGGQAAGDAVISITSLAAASMNLGTRIGTLAPGFEADIIAVDGNPLEDITALRRVLFVMRGGKIVRNVRGRNES